MAPNVNIEKSGGCGHFSMRGFCLERRKKDLDACMPFSRILLPPMAARDFKYWRCQNCTGIEVGNVPDSHGDAIFPSSAELAKLSSGLRRASEGSNFGARKENNGHTPLDLNVDPSSSSCRKETEAVATVGDDNRACNECGANAGDSVNQLTEFSQVVPDVNASLTVDISGSEPGLLENNGVHSTVYGAASGFRTANPDIDGSTEISDVGLNARFSNPEGKQNSEICSSNPPTKSDKQQGKVLTDSEMIGVSDESSHKNEALNPIEDQTARLYPKEVDEGESDHSGGHDVNIIRNAPPAKDLPSNHIEVSGATCQKKKAQKVRLMSDILSSGDAVTSCKDSDSVTETISDNIVTEASHDKGIDLNLDLNLNNQGCVEGNDKSVVPSSKRKRTKFSQEADQLPTMMNFSEHAREADAKNAYTVDVNSIESRSRLTKHINDGKLTSSQKKQKRSRIEIGQSSSVRQEEAHVEAGAETAPSKPKRNALSRTGLDIDMNKDFSQLQDANSFLMYGPEGISGRDQILGRDTENRHTPPAKCPYPVTAGFIQQRLDHNLATNKKAISSKKQNGLPQSKGGVDMREAAISFKFQPRAPSCNNSSTESHGPQNISKTQNDDSIHNAAQQAAFDDIPMEIVELMARNQHERRLSGEGSSQNITYLSRTENTKDTSANRTDVTDILGSEMSKMLYEKNSGSKKNSSSNEGNIISSKGRSAIPNKKKSDGFLFPAVSKNKHINFSVSQPTQCAHGSLKFPPFSKNHDQPPTGFPFSARGSSSINCDQNLIWKEDMPPNNRSSVPLCPSLESHQMPEKVSGNSSSRKDRHPWSPMVPNGSPFRVNGPEMFVAEPSKLKRPSQCSEPSHRGIFYRDHDLPFVNLQKQERNYSNRAKETNCDLQLGAGRGDSSHLKKMGPLDMYSSDQTIPAMHLLKLMDAGQNFSKQAPYPTSVHQKDLSSFEKERSKSLMPPPSSRLLNSVEQFPPVLNFGAVASSQKSADSRMSKENNYWETVLSSSSLEAHEDEQAKRKNSLSQPTGSKYKSPISLQDSGKDLTLATGSLPFMGQAKEVGQPKSTNPVAQPRVQGSSSSGKHHQYVTPTFYFVKKPASVSNPMLLKEKPQEIAKPVINVASVSNSMLLKEKPQEIAKPVINVESEVSSTKEINVPVTGNPGPSSINRSEINLPVKEDLGDCDTNRNPADFFAPGPENMYMLSGEDFRRRSPSSEPRSRPSSNPETSNQSPNKRQKTTNPGYPNP